MRKLTAKLDDARRENEELRRENIDLKLRPAQRAYVDADDERESNAWREKANNLLTLLDNLQHDMQNDLRDLEAETQSPGSSRLSKGTDKTAAAAAAASPTKPSDTTVDADSSKRRDRKRRTDEAAAPASSQAAPAAAAAAPATAAASNTSAAAADTGAGEDGGRRKRKRDAAAATPMTDQQAADLDAGYKAFAASARYIHSLYKNVKAKIDGNPAQKTEWDSIHEPIKRAAKTVRAAAKPSEVVSVTADDFGSSAREIAQDCDDWAKSALAFGASQKSAKITAAAEAFAAAVAAFNATLGEANAQNGAGVKAHADAAAALAAALRRVVAEQAAVFGVGPNE